MTQRISVKKKKISGSWELLSYQEEVAALKYEIEDMKGQLVAKDKTIEELRK